jgi:hypothetical protein
VKPYRHAEFDPPRFPENLAPQHKIRQTSGSNLARMPTEICSESNCVRWWHSGVNWPPILNAIRSNMNTVKANDAEHTKLQSKTTVISIFYYYPYLPTPALLHFPANFPLFIASSNLGPSNDDNIATEFVRFKRPITCRIVFSVRRTSGVVHNKHWRAALTFWAHSEQETLFEEGKCQAMFGHNTAINSLYSLINQNPKFLHSNFLPLPVHFDSCFHSVFPFTFPDRPLFVPMERTVDVIWRKHHKSPRRKGPRRPPKVAGEGAKFLFGIEAGNNSTMMCCLRGFGLGAMMRICLFAEGGGSAWKWLWVLNKP